MKKNKFFRRNKYDENDTIEKLKGKIRELTKQLDSEKRYSKSLEKRITEADRVPKINKNEENKVRKKESAAFCPQCKHENTMEEKVFYSPNKKLIWLICSNCLYKEKL